MSADPEVSLEPLGRALRDLAEALATPKSDLVRDGTIQRFTYSFELSWKTLRRVLYLTSGVREDSIKSILREAGRLQLIEDVEAWFGFQRARNLASHVYRQETAEAVYEAAQRFLPEAQQLLDRLTRRLVDSGT